MNNDKVETVQARSGARRRRETRARIVAAALDLILDDATYATLSMADIATRADVSRATLYLHFSEKREILADIASAIVEQRFEIGAELVGDPSMDRAGMRSIVSEMTTRWLDDVRLLQAIVRLADEDLQVREIWAGAVHEVGDMGAEQMRRRWAGSASDFPDAQMLGRVVAWMFERATYQLSRDPDQVDRVVDAITEVVWRVIDYRPADPAEGVSRTD